MVCNKYLIRLKVKNQLSEVFIGILHEISELGLCSEKDELMIQQNNGLMNGDQFLHDLYMIVKRYVPVKNENLLIKAIGLLPRAIKNVQHIKQNSGIIVLQDKILDKYFNSMSDENIKKKLQELENEIDRIIEEEDDRLKVIESLLSNFKDRMRAGFVSDLEHLSQLLEETN